MPGGEPWVCSRAAATITKGKKHSNKKGILFIFPNAGNKENMDSSNQMTN